VTGDVIEELLDEASTSVEGVGLKPSRAIGGSFNALVRATALYRKGVERFSVTTSDGISETQRAVSERAAKIWRKAKLLPLEIESTRVVIDGEEALRTDNTHAAWVLFAFMAGVRRITPRRAMTAGDMTRLVQALVGLEPTVESIESFRDWLDADGAEGFDVRVHTSFREVFEEVDLEEEREFSKAFQMARFEVPRSGDAVYIASKDLDMVAMRKEFEIPIEMYAAETTAAAAHGGMSDDELHAIGTRCDDANAWATAEIEAVLALPELRTAVTPEHMARRVVTRLSEEADARFLMLLTRLNTKGDTFRQAVAKALATQEVGEIIARQLRLEHEDTVEALGKFLVLSPAGIARAVMHGVLDRATDDPLGEVAVGSLVEWYGATQVCEWINPPDLREESATMLGKALSGVVLGPTELSNIVIGAPVEAGIAMLAAMPDKALKPLGRPLRTLWGRTNKDEKKVESVAELMVRGGAPENLKVLAELLLDGKCDKWSGKVLYALCAGLVTAGLGPSHMLPLVQKRNASEQVRLIAIDSCRRDEKLVAEAKRFRFAGLLDTPKVRERLKALAYAPVAPHAKGSESK
jgi:hypothetical protein